jgi:hypothetical protein
MLMNIFRNVRPLIPIESEMNKYCLFTVKIQQSLYKPGQVLGVPGA